MDIHFCDLCNESVPQSDLDEGRAHLRRGRVVCAACERAMTHAEGAEPHASHLLDEVAPGAETASSLAATVVMPAPAAAPEAVGGTSPVPPPTERPREWPPVAPPPALIPAPAPRAATGVVLAIVALLFSAGALAVLNEQIRALGERGDAVEGRLRTQSFELRDLERSNADALRTIASLEDQIGERLADERDRAESALSQLREEAERLQAEQKDLLARLDEVRAGALEKGQDADRRTGEMAERLAKSEADGRVLLERIAKLEEQSLRPPPPAVAEGGAPAASRWGALVDDLQSPKAATRWEAVDQIGQTGDPETVPYLLPMLKDTDVFVRMATARVLGDLRASAAVPALIDALEDAEAAVREAALGSLRGITGKDLRFDPLASEADRAKKVKAWREWWKKVEEEGGMTKGQE